MRCLIYMREDGLSASGGPIGYCYNINQLSKEKKDKEICFLSIGLYKKTALPYMVFRKIRQIFLNKVLKQNTKIISIKNTMIDAHYRKAIGLSSYDFVHFHTTSSFYSSKRELLNYKGITILTSHSPKVYYREIIEDDISNEEYLYNKKIYDDAELIDEYAFKNSDIVIFPCPGAEEPYFHSWPKYKDIRDESKIRYVPTGILPVECKKTRVEIRNELNIPQDAIVLSFVGRHNEVKGYDILQDIFSRLDNAYVICCGNIGAIKPPESDRWIEIGWTTDPYSYVGASDIYMLPNRETYFDIAMLQTLSIGKCSVISNTGGNKEFVKTPGVKLYDTVDEAVKCIKEFILMPMEEKLDLEHLQRIEFEEKYTIEVFYKNYKNTLKKLLEEKSNGK